LHDLTSFPNIGLEVQGIPSPEISFLTNSASLEFHLNKGAAEFRNFASLLDLLSIEVYGQVSEAVIARLGEKARMLGSGTVTLHEFYAGFARQLLSLRR
jgi:hypothetical protein